jgi:branched-subunit amino acid aminotransferase/4-amino-4-deoxychorismate lyase
MLDNGKQGDSISIRDRGLLYSDGMFSAIRVSRSYTPHWPLHYQKLQHDCTTLGIPCPDFASLSAESYSWCTASRACGRHTNRNNASGPIFRPLH